MITITKLRKALQKDDNLKKIRDNLYYLLSEYERKELNRYLKNYNLTYSKKYFIDNFLNRIKKLPIDKQKERIDLLLRYIIVEPNLSLQTGMVFDLDYNLPIKTSEEIKDKPSGYSQDAYFNFLVENDKYDELFNLYGLEQIERDSNLLGDTK